MSSQPGTLWIGDLDPYIDEAFLKQSFLLMGEILRQAKIIRNKYDGSKLGYGFLEFGDEATARRVLNRCNGKVIPNSNGSKRFKLNYANQGKDSGSSSSRSSSMPAVPGQDYQQCYQYPAYDYQSYYAAWQNYQNQNQYYNYGYDQNYAASYDTSRYQQSQPQQPQQPPSQQQPQQQPPPQQQQSSSAQQPAQAQQSSQYYNSTYDASDNLIEEHDTPPEVEQLNEELMNRNEELYAALENSRWLPVEDLVPPLIKIK